MTTLAIPCCCFCGHRVGEDGEKILPFGWCCQGCHDELLPEDASWEIAYRRLSRDRRVAVVGISNIRDVA